MTRELEVTQRIDPDDRDQYALGERLFDRLDGTDDIVIVAEDPNDNPSADLFTRILNQISWRRSPTNVYNLIVPELDAEEGDRVKLDVSDEPATVEHEIGHRMFEADEITDD